MNSLIYATTTVALFILQRNCQKNQEMGNYLYSGFSSSVKIVSDAWPCQIIVSSL